MKHDLYFSTFLLLLSILPIKLAANEHLRRKTSVQHEAVPSWLHHLSPTQRPETGKNQSSRKTNFVHLMRKAFTSVKIKSDQFKSDYNTDPPTRTDPPKMIPSSTESSNSTESTSPNSTDVSTASTISATTNTDSDLDDQPLASTPDATEQPTDSESSTVVPDAPGAGNNKLNGTKTGDGHPKSGVGILPIHTTTLQSPMGLFIERIVVYHSLFIIYVSVVKILYNNVSCIQSSITEQGTLMLAGIIWELVIRQTNVEIDQRPRFNSRLFFYLFLPSVIYESSSFLANKWLLLNLLPIILTSLIGTIMYSTALGLTIYSLNHQDILNFTRVTQLTTANFWQYSINGSISQQVEESVSPIDTTLLNTFSPPSSATNLKSLAATTTILSSLPADQLDNLSLIECLLLSVALSSTDSSAILNSLKQLQLNERLYYLILGKNVLNNAVVMILTTLLMDFFGNTRVTVLKIYMTVLQFFTNLAGSILLGVLLAILALGLIRIIKRFQPKTKFLNHNEAMVETLMLLKVAYLTYTLAAVIGMSGIISLGTFAVLNDQYIKQNLNLRSQLAIRQLILAIRTLSFSFVYSFLGMLLVEVADGNLLLNTGAHRNLSGQVNSQSTNTSTLMMSASSVADTSEVVRAGKDYVDNAGWNLKFLSIVLVLSVSFRFVTIFVFSSLSNLLSSTSLKIRLREQFLIAYGGFTSPLAMALVQGLIEHGEFRETTMKNKHLFMYTVLSITFITATIFGTLVKPMVVKIHESLIRSGRSSSVDGSGTFDFEDRVGATKVFIEFNNKLLEHMGRGLSSIVGHSRSSYDRIGDFNETHIKPWLAQSGSNTNWLSVFYDNVVLDETLNANSFQVATQDLTDLRASRRRSRLLATVWRRKTWRTNRPITPLDTISERADKTDMDAHDYSASSQLTWLSRQPNVARSAVRKRVVVTNKREVQSRTHPAHYQNPKAPRSITSPVDDDAALKELVMLNLKLDDAKRRRRTAQEAHRYHTNNNISLESIYHMNSRVVRSPNTPKHSSMLDSTRVIGGQPKESSHKGPKRYDTRTISSASTANITVGDDFVEPSSSGSRKRRERKQSLFLELEQNLNDVSIDKLRSNQFESIKNKPTRQKVDRQSHEETDLYNSFGDQRHSRQRSNSRKLPHSHEPHRKKIKSAKRDLASEVVRNVHGNGSPSSSHVRIRQPNKSSSSTDT